jgi:hypothetical protein
MCNPKEIRRVHRQTNDEIRRALNSLSEHAAATNDQVLDTLTVNLREVLAKRFLINGIADWQRDDQKLCSPEEPPRE